MPEEVAGIQPQETQPIAPPATPPVAAPANAPTPTGDPRVMHMPTHAIGRLKKEALEKGRKAALKEIAEQGGFASVEEMLLQLPKLKNPTAIEPAAQPPKNVQQQVKPGAQVAGNDKRLQKDIERLQREKDEIARRMKREASARKQLQRELDARDAEMVLREAAVAAGVKDVDYGVRLLSRHLEGKTEEELKAFDEAAFFQSLKASHPYLFGEKIVPANTGTGSTVGAPPAPKPGAVQQVQSQSGQVDVRKMSPREFAAHVASLGLQVPVA